MLSEADALQAASWRKMLIRFNIETDERNTVVDPTINRYNFKKTNWEKFEEVLKDDNFDASW